jgi:hypothetical protein
MVFGACRRALRVMPLRAGMYPQFDGSLPETTTPRKGAALWIGAGQGL